MTIGEYIATLKGLEANLQPFVDIAIDVGGEELEANLKKRVFNANVDISGKGFEGYSDIYKSYRLNLGKDISKKNLQLTDRMRFGIFFDTEKKELRFRDDIDAEKGRWNEEYLKKKHGLTDIFTASESEIEKTISVIEEEFNNLIGEQLN